MKTTITIKVWRETLQRLRMIYAITGESMVSILHRIVSDELVKVKKQWRG
jgi:hypothetical protein